MVTLVMSRGDRGHHRHLTDSGQGPLRVNDLVDGMIKNSSFMDTKARHKARDKLHKMGSTQKLSLREIFQNDVLALRQELQDGDPTFLASSNFTPIDVENRVATSTPNVNDIPSVTRWFLYESKPYDKDNRDITKHNMAILSQKLEKGKGVAGIFPLLGFREETSAFQLVFSGQFTKLATAVLQTHALELVHKSIRPENILVLPAGSPNASVGEDIPAIYLCGWQYARQVKQHATTFKNMVTPQHKIYQHPERQIPTARA
ncbi:hypothetical protein QQX98_005490 [Neonectria punicea]|uniref:Protein kinase domain-containing protein n=1 Tax=Neonectria punicea TaxID=979145 RepID=A0ABR1H4R8_9HYPO